MSLFLQTLADQRKKFLEGLDANDGDINLDIFEDFYPDQAHFVFELLQNAEDVCATEAIFTLTKKGCSFEHNGSRTFSKDDVRAITGIHNSTKTKVADQIGKFGVGFKSVFVYTLTPMIWSGDFSFKIERFVLPVKMDADSGIGARTKFEFPFNHPNKTPETAHAEVKAGLTELSETTLLFLSHLESISWQIDESLSGEVLRVQHSQNHFEVLKQINNKTTTSSHFLKFDQPVEKLNKQCVAVAFALDFLPNVQQFDPKQPLAKQLKIIPSEPGRVAVFFPAEKETSGLRFHVHAPFVPELSRASIKETPINQPLFHSLATLTVASLHQIRDIGLLNVEFLGVLPNPQDSIPSRYEEFRASIIEEMNNELLTPTETKAYAPAKHLLQGKASLKELLTEKDIEFLIDYDEVPPQWAKSAAQKNTNADRFLSGLAIIEWDIEHFVELLKEKATEKDWQEPDANFMAWLAGMPIAWHQQLYALLYKELHPEGELYQLKNLRIIRLSDGTYSVGSKCFLPSDGVEHDEVLPRVDAGVYTYGKSKTQQENARKFLEEIGVREVGEAEQVEAILKRRYTYEAESPNEKTHIRDLKRFITLVKKTPDKAALFEDYYIFMGTDKMWHKPGGIFLDMPFADTHLAAYYEALGNGESVALSSSYYKDCGIAIERLASFAESVGVRTSLEIKKVSCRDNPNVRYLVWQAPGRSTSYECNEDYYIHSIEKVINHKSVTLSRLIWKSISNFPERWTKARYCKNFSQPYRVAPSQLAVILAENEWVPQGNEGFVRPRDASLKLIPKGFPIDKGWEWLKDIGFGENEAKREEESARQSEEARQKEAIAKELGFVDHETLERAIRFAALPSDEQQRILSELEFRKSTDLPNHEPSKPERRTERVGKQATDAPERKTEDRTRSVSIGLEMVKEEAAQYLRQQYTNGEGEMICQICKAELPFKLDNGNPYFEKVEFLPNLKKRYYQNYLALCPNHAAMFQHANGSADLMQDMFIELAGNELEVVIAQKNATIYFTRTHVADLKSVLSIDSESIVEDVGRA